jgi:hypothetical protein
MNYASTSASNYKRLQMMKGATMRYAYRTLVYVFILSMVGGFIGASTNNRWAMLLGTMPGLIGIFLLMYVYHDHEDSNLESPRACKRLTLAHHCIGSAAAFWTFVVSMHLLIAF